MLKPEKNTRETVMCGGTLHRSLMFTQNMPRHYHHRQHYHHHNYHTPKSQSFPKPSTNTTAITDNNHNNPSGTTTTSVILEPYSTSSETETPPTGTPFSKVHIKDDRVLSVPDKLFSDDEEINNDDINEHKLKDSACTESMTRFLWDTNNKNKLQTTTNDDTKVMVDHSQIRKCLTSSSSNAIKHETKAVLENGHQHWPSIKLDSNSNIIKPM